MFYLLKKLLGAFVKYFVKFFCAVEICVAKRNLSIFLQCNTPFGFDTVWVLLYSSVMATWHVTVNPHSYSSSQYTQALHALLLKSTAAEFECLGFSVKPIPECGVAALSVSHASASAVTLYRLRYDARDLIIVDVV